MTSSPINWALPISALYASAGVRAWHGISRAMTLLFATSGGAAVGNLYWAQPLLADIALTFRVSVGSAGVLITMTQIGYAVGILILVPLGDTLNRRRLIPSVMMCSSVALFACAFAPSFAALLAALCCVGLTTVASQILTPLAGDLARPEERGRVVGTVVSGLISGILLSRTVSGFLAEAFGWRSVYIVAGAAITGHNHDGVYVPLNNATGSVWEQLRTVDKINDKIGVEKFADFARHQPVGRASNCQRGRWFPHCEGSLKQVIEHHMLRETH